MTEKTSPNDPKEWQRLAAEFQHKGDRAAAILGAVYLESYLGQLIADFLIKDKAMVVKLLGEEYPLGSFSARIKAAYCMGLISANEYNDLGLILAIRNIFANDIEGATFTDDGIREKCFMLKIPRALLLPGETRTPRRLFVFASTILTQHLALRAAHAVNERRTVPVEFMLIDTGD